MKREYVDADIDMWNTGEAERARRRDRKRGRPRMVVDGAALKHNHGRITRKTKPHKEYSND